MGGSVQLVVRNKEGAITALPVWTNSMVAKLLKNPKFLAGDFSYLTEFVNYHRELMADYDTNHITRTFKDSNAGFFGHLPFGHLSPVEYGIVVVDFKEMKIIDMQDYTSIESIYMSLKRTIKSKDFELVSLSSSGQDVKDIEEFISKGYFKTVQSPFDKSISYDISHIRTLQDLLIMLGDYLENVEMPMAFKVYDKESFQLNLVIDRQGFELLSFKPRQVENIPAAQKEMIKLGFPLTADDIERWDFYINSQDR